MNNTVRSASRVLDLLELLSTKKEGATLTECVTAMQIPKSSMLMLLNTVVARGYAIKDETDRYTLNENFIRHGFGWGGDPIKRLIAIAQPIMNELTERVGETVLLSSAGKSGVQILVKALPTAIVRYDDPGTIEAPFFCTAIGRILLAHADQATYDAQLVHFPRTAITAKTVTDLAALQKIVADAKAQNIAFSEDEYADGGTGVAMPIFKRPGEVLAVLTIGAVSSRYPEKKQFIIEQLRNAVQRITNALENKSQLQPI